MAVVGLVRPVVVGENAAAEVRDQGCHDIGVSVLAGVLHCAVAVLDRWEAASCASARCTVGRRLCVVEDSGSEVLGGDPRGEELVQGIAGAEEPAQENSGQIVSDVKDQLARELRERHGGIAGSKGVGRWFCGDGGRGGWTGRGQREGKPSPIFDMRSSADFSRVRNSV